MARDDDIFRKLKKETPLIKRKDLQPLANRDFPGRSAFDIKIEKQQKNRTARRPSADELSVFSRESKTSKPAAHRSSTPAARRDVDVFGAKVSEPKKSPRTEQKRETERQYTISKPTQKSEKKSYEDIRTRIGMRNAPNAAAELETLRARHTHQVQSRRPAAHSLAEPDEAVEEMRQAQKNGALSYRHELKYYINYRDYVLLKNSLKAILPLDRYSGENGDYHIRSLYFDDVYETALAEKVAGSDVRSKYRIRIYNFNDGVIKFEKKIKNGQFIAKETIKLSRDDCERLVAGDFTALEGRKEPLAAEIYLQMKNNCLAPRVIVDYRREAYISPIENVRITFDKDLKAGLWITDIFNEDAPTMPVFDTGMMVLEVKFNKYLPPYIKAIINNVNTAQRSAISKYVLCRRHN